MWHSPPGDRIGRDKSTYAKHATKKGILTTWRPRRKAQARIQKECDRVNGTHPLETASGGVSQDMDRMRPKKATLTP